MVGASTPRTVFVEGAGMPRCLSGSAARQTPGGRTSSEPGRVADHEAGRRPRAARPAVALAPVAGIEAAAVDRHEGVARVRVDRDVADRAGCAVAHEAGR